MYGTFSVEHALNVKSSRGKDMATQLEMKKKQLIGTEDY